MSGSLVTRVEKLEAQVQPASEHELRLIRLCTTDEDEVATWAEADRCGISEEQVLVIRLVPLEPEEPLALGMISGTED